jgi:hypothetical protein
MKDLTLPESAKLDDPAMSTPADILKAYTSWGDAEGARFHLPSRKVSKNS